MSHEKENTSFLRSCSASCCRSVRPRRFWSAEARIRFEPKGAAPVLFNHEKHVAANGRTCSGCHFGVFQMEKGSNRMNMSKITKGHFCGTCHNGKDRLRRGRPVAVRDDAISDGRRASVRCCSSLSPGFCAARGHGVPGIIGPGMFRVAALEVLFHQLIGIVPEPLQVLRDLDRPSRRGQ